MPGTLSQKPLVGITVNRDYRRGRLWQSRSYCLRVEEAGALPLLLPPLLPASAGGLLDPLSGLLLGGGGDVAPFHYGAEPEPGLGKVDPQRDAWELALVRAALCRGLPLFGICRGVQLLNVALGGTLHQDLKGPGCLQHDQRAPRHHPSHSVEVLPRTQLAAIIGEGRLAVNSFHHQGLAATGAGLLKAALSPDGVVEALEDPGHSFLIGVQWHPESLEHPASRLLFQAFAGAAATYLQR